LFVRRRLIVVFVLLTLACGAVATLWQWKVPSMVRRRVEQVTGHKATIAGVSLNHRLEIVVRDVRIAGSPPFESQTLAWADRVVVRLRGPGGFLTPSEIAIDGLDIEYLGTAAGDNLRVPAPPAKTGPSTSRNAGSTASPKVSARNVRLRGSLAIPHAPLIEFRVTQAEFERRLDGTMKVALQHLVVDAEGMGSLRVLALSGEYDRHRLSVVSGGNVAIEIPGGGTWIENLALAGTLLADKADVEIQRRDTAENRTLFTGHWQPGIVAIAVDAHEVPLRALGAVSANRSVGLEKAKASARGTITVDHGHADFEFEGKVRGVDLLHPAIDLVPWRNQTASLGLRGSADLASGRIEITSGDLKALSAPLSFKGWVELMQAPRGSLVLFTPPRSPLPCATLLSGQPDPVKQALAGLDLDGRLGIKLAMEFDASAWENLSLDVDVEPRCEVRREAEALAKLLPVLLKSSAKEQAPSNLPLGALHPDFIPLSQMPRHLPSAFLTSEDSKFFRHHGFDMDMIRHALAQDLENRSFDRGASTITQQLAKNLFLSHKRTLARKLEEAVLTWRLQKLLSKDRVLELYLNVIELGPGIRGVKQAAHSYFGKDVAELTPLESAHLAALTPNPHVLARRFRDGQVDEGWQQRLYDLLGMMKRHGRLSAAELAAARGSKLALRDLSQDAAAHGKH
jgi:Transglycosylase